jgi:RNA polymerase sigma-70 factor (ECF subfamily)
MLFEKSWALQVLERTMDRLEAEMVASGKREQFDHLKVYLTTDKDTTAYEAMATELSMTEGSLRVAVHRLRRHYRKILRDEVAQTVSHVDQIDEEIGHLFSALAY